MNIDCRPVEIMPHHDCTVGAVPFKLMLPSSVGIWPATQLAFLMMQRIVHVHVVHQLQKVLSYGTPIL